MDLALYHPELGFYATGGRAGRRGDFLTSPEVGPAVRRGAWPGPSTAGGTRWAGPTRSWWSRPVRAPACWPAPCCWPSRPARRRCATCSSSGRRRCGSSTDAPSSSPRRRSGSARRAVDADGIERPSQIGVGPVVVSLGELPALDRPVVVLANELLDNLAFRLLERGERRWQEVRVGIDGEEVRLAEVLVPAEDDQVRLGRRARPRRRAGRPGAGAGRGAALAAPARSHLAAPGGRVVCFDYAARTADLAARPVGEWLRTYAGHGRGGHARPRSASRTSPARSASTSWPGCGAPARDRSQADWLRDHGIDELVDEGRRVLGRAGRGRRPRGARGPAAGCSEAEALSTPTGLGAFRVLEWHA